MIEIILISVLFSLILALIYKYGTDQNEVKELKKTVQKYKKKVDKAKKKGDQNEMNKEMKKMMDMQGKMMKKNLRPMIFTFIVVIPLIMFVLPGLYEGPKIGVEEKNVELFEGKITAKPSEDFILINGEKINYGENFNVNGENYEIQKTGKKIKFARVITNLPFSLPVIGNQMGWLGTYIITALPFTQLFRKLLGVEG